MKKIIFAAALSLILTGPSFAADVTKGDISITGPFARASAKKAKAGGAFMTITSKGDADKVVSASSDIAKRTELHTHIKDGDVMRMREVEFIEVPANGSVALEPGSYHVMFMGLKQPLVEGEHVKVELTFEKAGVIPVMVEVGGIGAMKPMKHKH